MTLLKINRGHGVDFISANAARVRKAYLTKDVDGSQPSIPTSGGDRPNAS